ncbi:MAG: cell division protein FtsQ [Alphaproteobacteria bacterium 13_2_20CM_2_64_7]|nr:MAG: cell division protein FtsQ [Alphaproteobacteria bacterium 13_2_20CM_2_64_7]
MDDRGRLAQPLNWNARWRLRPAARAAARGATDAKAMRPKSRIARVMDRWSSFLENKWPRGVGVAASALVILASLAYGTVKGDHIPSLIAGLKDARDGIANAAGFRVVSIALVGNHHVNREEVLATAGITGTTSLLFLDVDQIRLRLKTNPWIADATVLKLYPGELQIGIKEREAFALWQKDGRISVIADDGTVLEPYVAPRLTRLPLVVGRGAQAKAKEFLALLDRYPTMRDFVHASVLVGERRWNLRLKNGIDVRLPESDVAPALERLVALDREKNLITRDIVAIDLRLADRVTVRLTEAAAQARMDASKDKPKKRDGSA